MKTGTRKLGPSTVHVGYTQIVSAHLRGKVRELTAFHTEAEMRGQGYGKALMRDICDEADHERITLMLIADSMDLAFWYAGSGFVLLQEGPMVMIREPAQ